MESGKLSDSIVRPPRVELKNVATGDSIECLFNPTQLIEKVQVNWNRLNVPGLSHQVLQYQSTGNRQLNGVEFYLDHFFASTHSEDDKLQAFRVFLRALTVPPRARQGIVGGAPPRVLIVWPKVISITTVLTSLEFQYKQFANDNTILVYTAICSFEQILDKRVYSKQLRNER